MIEELARRLFRRRKAKQFSAWQIELTTRCPLQCRMCVRAGCSNWQNEDMSLESFKKLLPHLKEVETVVLEGWGESLLHKNLFECVRLVKKEGPEVGFVTSGMGLSEKLASDLVDAGVDFVGFSLAGTTPTVHNRIRVNSDFEKILKAVRTIQEAKQLKRTDRPRIHIVYLMLKENLGDLPGLPRLAEELRVYEVVLLNIIQVTNEWQDEQKIFSCEAGESEYHEVVEGMEREARSRGITVRRPALCAVDVAVCSENPLRNLYIAANGAVSPCVYLYPPVATPFRRIFCGLETHQEKISFGNIFTESFASIWNSKQYGEFRDAFLRRQKFFLDTSLAFLDTSRLAELRQTTPPEPPEPCRTCHKMLGV